MTSKKHYLEELRGHLNVLPEDDVNEIIQDYEEHFVMGTAAGKSEPEIAKKLGRPKLVAQAYLTNISIDEVKSESSGGSAIRIFVRGLVTLLFLAPLNFIVVSGPFLLVLGALVLGWAVVGSFITGSSLAYWLYLTAESSEVIGAFSNLSLFFMWVGAVGLCAMLAVVMIVASRFSLAGMLSYIKWNINVVMNRSRGGFA